MVVRYVPLQTVELDEAAERAEWTKKILREGLPAATQNSSNFGMQLEEYLLNRRRSAGSRRFQSYTYGFWS